MKIPLLPLVAALVAHLGAAGAEERPENTTICDYYAEKTVGANTAGNQQLLMHLVLANALLGPYSKYSTVKVPNFPGSLVPTTFAGDYVDLNGYFNGGFASTNTGLGYGVSASFFDDGGLDATRQNKPGFGNTTSYQYKFFTHVYSYFGTFLGCSHIGSKDFPSYAGKASMYEVHKFMYLNNGEMLYFIDQAVRGLLSIGFTGKDAQFVNTTLVAVFNARCAPAAAVVPPDAPPSLQAICIAPDCPLSPNDTCAAYQAISPPAVINNSLAGGVVKATNGTTTHKNGSATTSGADGLARYEYLGVWLSVLCAGFLAYGRTA